VQDLVQETDLEVPSSIRACSESRRIATQAWIVRWLRL
jgi:hypothetical protein